MRRKEIADHPFSKDKFKEALKRAIGERSQSEFCAASDLSYAYVNRYSNGKMDSAPTLGTIKKIAGAAEDITFEELLCAAGYDPEKYKAERPRKAERKDFLHPVFIGIANSDIDWRIEAASINDGEPFEIIIEREDVKKWFFVPVMKKEVTKEDIQNILLNEPKFDSSSKVSFVTDDWDIYDRLKEIEFPLLSLYVSVIKVIGQEVEEEINLRTNQETSITICNKDEKRPLYIE